MKTLTVVQEITISEKAFEVLKGLESGGYAEYRDKHETVEEFMESQEYKDGKRDVEWFKNRNHGGTYKEAIELLENGLVDDKDGMSWHETYWITDLGKKLLEQNK